MNESYENLMELDDDEEFVRPPRWWSPGTVLTGEASSITAFTLAVAGLMGWIGFPVAEALLGATGFPDEHRERLVLSALVVLVVLIGTFWLCQRVLLDDDEGVAAWARHLAGASAVIAAIGATLSIVTVIAGLLVENPDFPGRIGP